MYSQPFRQEGKVHGPNVLDAKAIRDRFAIRTPIHWVEFIAYTNFSKELM